MATALHIWGFALLVLCAKVRPVTVAGSSNHAQSAEWEYGQGDQGVQHWTEIEPRCNGTHQSPINLHDAKYNASLHHMHFEGYHNGEEFNFTMVNNGHSAKVSLPRNFYLAGSGLNGSYVADSLHFHWGQRNSYGSEHHIHGQVFPMEMHIVHYYEGYRNLADADQNGTSDSIAVTGFLFEISSQSNPYLDSLISSLSHVQEPDHSYSIPGFPLDSLLPFRHHYYYRYEGSLTTPDCIEKVIWNVFADRVPISADQLAQFRLLKDHQGQGLYDNFRPEQKLNDRQIFTNMQNDSTQNSAFGAATSGGWSICLNHFELLVASFVAIKMYTL